MNWTYVTTTEDVNCWHCRALSAERRVIGPAFVAQAEREIAAQMRAEDEDRERMIEKAIRESKNGQ